MQNNLSLKTYFSLIFHHYPKAHSNLCTSHHWVEIGKVCYSSASLHTLLYLPKMFFIHLQDTGCPQISSSNSTSCLLSFIHSLNVFIGPEVSLVTCVGIPLHFPHLYHVHLITAPSPPPYPGPAHSVNPNSIPVFHC